MLHHHRNLSARDVIIGTEAGAGVPLDDTDVVHIADRFIVIGALQHIGKNGRTEHARGKTDAGSAKNNACKKRRKCDGN